jgi:hypothetical protein
MSRCAADGCDKPVPELAVRHKDEFCSTKCCRRQHGVVFPSDSRGYGPARQVVLRPCPTCHGVRVRRPNGKIRCPACESTQGKARRKAMRRAA